jgi:preprotein translocase subunit SecG
VRRHRSTTSGGRRAGWRRSSCEPLEIGQPELDERPDTVLETGLARDRERLLVGLADLRGIDALLQPVVSGHEQLLDPRTGVVACRHEARLQVSSGPMFGVLAVWLQLSAVVQVLLAAFLITLVLMHSGREAGMGGLGFTPHSQGGTHIVERNLTRLTVVVSVVFTLNTLLLFHLL